MNRVTFPGKDPERRRLGRCRARGGGAPSQDLGSGWGDQTVIGPGTVGEGDPLGGAGQALGADPDPAADAVALAPHPVHVRAAGEHARVRRHSGAQDGDAAAFPVGRHRAVHVDTQGDAAIEVHVQQRPIGGGKANRPARPCSSSAWDIAAPLSAEDAPGFSPGRDRLFSTRPCSVRDLCIYAGAQRHALPADVIAVDGPESRLSTAAQDGPRCRFERLAFACEDGRAGQVAAECRRGAAAAGDAAHVQQGRGPGLPCCFRQAGVLKARPAETLSWQPGYGWRPWICSPPRRCAAPRRAGCWKAAANYAHEPGSTHQAPWNRSSRLAR